MTWGVEANVVERFASAGVPSDRVSCVKDTYTFNYAGTPTAFVDAFRKYYGPTMNAFEAAEKNGRASDLKTEFDTLFESKNTEREPGQDLDTRDLPAGDGPRALKGRSLPWVLSRAWQYPMAAATSSIQPASFCVVMFHGPLASAILSFRACCRLSLDSPSGHGLYFCDRIRGRSQWPSISLRRSAISKVSLSTASTRTRSRCCRSPGGSATRRVTARVAAVAPARRPSRTCPSFTRSTRQLQVFSPRAQPAAPQGGHDHASQGGQGPAGVPGRQAQRCPGLQRRARRRHVGTGVGNGEPGVCQGRLRVPPAEG